MHLSSTVTRREFICALRGHCDDYALQLHSQFTVRCAIICVCSLCNINSTLLQCKQYMYIGYHFFM